MSSELLATVQYDGYNQPIVLLRVIQWQTGTITVWSEDWDLAGKLIVMTVRQPTSATEVLAELRSDGESPAIVVNPEGADPADNTKLRVTLASQLTANWGEAVNGAWYDIIAVDEAATPDTRQPLLRGRLLTSTSPTRELSA